MPRFYGSTDFSIYMFAKINNCSSVSKVFPRLWNERTNKNGRWEKWWNIEVEEFYIAISKKWISKKVIADEIIV